MPINLTKTTYDYLEDDKLQFKQVKMLLGWWNLNWRWVKSILILILIKKTDNTPGLTLYYDNEKWGISFSDLHQRFLFF